MPPDENPNPNPAPNPQPQSDPAADTGPKPVPFEKHQEVMRSRAEAKKRAEALEAQYQQLLEANDGAPVTPEDIKQWAQARKDKEAAEAEAARKRGDFEKLLESERSAHKAALNSREERYQKLFSEYSGEKLRALAAGLVAGKVTEGAVDFATNALIQGDPKQGVRMEFAQTKKDGPHAPRLVDSTGNVAVDPETGEPLTLEKYRDRFFANHSFLARPEVRTGPGPSVDAGEPVARVEDLRRKIQAAVDSGDQESFRKHRKQLFELSPAEAI